MKGGAMVKMILIMLAMEQDIKKILDYVDHIAGEFQGFDGNPVVITLRNHLENLAIRHQEAINQWSQLGADRTF
jgi:hypothetical protein